MSGYVISASAPFIGFTDDGTVRMVLGFTAALAALLAVIAFLVKKYRAEAWDGYKKTAGGIIAGYSLGVIAILSYLTFSDGAEAEPLLTYPVMAAVIIAGAGVFAVWAASLVSRRAAKISGIVFAAAEACAFVAVMVCMSLFYESVKGDPEYSAETGIDFSTVNTAGLIVSAVVFSLLIALLYLIGGKRREENGTRAVVYGAISIALSFALSYIKFLQLGQGGSVTFASLLPLMVYSCMFGTRRGIAASLIFGAMQSIVEPMGVLHPMQFLLDYPIAAGFVGVSGIFMEKGIFKGRRVVQFLLGAALPSLARYACHVCSGVFAFASYADLDTYSSALVYSFAYNSVVFIDLAIVLAAGALLFASKAFNKQMDLSISAEKSAKETVVLNDDD